MSISDYDIVEKLDGPRSSHANPGWGSLVCVKSNMSCKVDPQYSKKICITCPSGKGPSESLRLMFCGIIFITIYKSPDCSIVTLEECLNCALRDGLGNLKITTTPTVVVGDFNIDFGKIPNHQIFKYFESNGFRALLKLATTRDNTRIDNIFTNFDAEGHIVECFFSHHKQLCIRTKYV